MSRYSIKDVERMTGIKAHTIRMWEKRYNIIEPQRTTTNIRYYSYGDLMKLVEIANLNHHGYKISFLAQLGDPELSKLTLSLTSKPLKVEAEINQMISATIAYDRIAMEYHLNNMIMQYGLERGFQRIFIPFIDNLYLLLQSGVINGTHLYFARSTAATKIIIATDQLPRLINSRTRVIFLIMLPSHRELSLLYFHYILRKRNADAYYFGRNIDLDELVTLCDQLKPDLILESYFDVRDPNIIYSHIKQLSKINLKTRIWIQAEAELDENYQLPENFFYACGLQDMIQKIEATFPQNY